VAGLLKLNSGIDWMNAQFGVVANWLVLLACLISAGNAASRYLFSESSNGWLEVQWYMFAGMVLLGGPALCKNERAGRPRLRRRFGAHPHLDRHLRRIVLLLPICLILVYFTWPWFVDSGGSPRAPRMPAA
jgi:TRAP-type mannitol/chloroaromatic compound transport system permease small subunit